MLGWGLPAQEAAGIRGAEGRWGQCWVSALCQWKLRQKEGHCRDSPRGGTVGLLTPEAWEEKSQG